MTGTDFQLFRLGLTLTEEGERHTDEIIELCYRFIALLRSEPPQKRIQVCEVNGMDCLWYGIVSIKCFFIYTIYCSIESTCDVVCMCCGMVQNGMFI